MPTPLPAPVGMPADQHHPQRRRQEGQGVEQPEGDIARPAVSARSICGSHRPMPYMPMTMQK